MTNPLYNVTGNPGNKAPGASATIRAEFAAIAAAFDKFPAFAGNAGKLFTVKDTEDGFTVVSAINGITIGLTTAAAAAFTTMAASGAVAAGGATLGGGNSYSVAATGSVLLQGGEVGASGYGIRLLNSTAQSGAGLTVPAGIGQGLTVTTDAGPLRFLVNSQNVYTISNTGFHLFGGASAVDQITTNGGIAAAGELFGINIATSALRIGRTSGFPVITWVNAGAASNNKVWDAYAAATTLNFRVIDDAGTGSRNWMSVTRSGIASGISVNFDGPVQAQTFNGLLATNVVSQFVNDAGYITSVGAAAAGALTGTTLASNVVTSSLTTVGTLGSLAVTNQVTAGAIAIQPASGAAVFNVIRPILGTQATLNLVTSGGSTWQIYLQSGSNDLRIYNSVIGSDVVTIAQSTGLVSFGASGIASNVTGNLNGNASTTTMAAGRTDATAYPVMWGTTGATSQLYSCSAVTIQSSTGTLTATALVGTTASISGLATVGASSTVGGILVGYRGLPSASVTTGAFTGADAGKCVYATAGVTIPNSTMQPGDVVIVQNTTGSAITITKTITTAYNCNAGSALGTTFTLGSRGRMAIVFETSTICDVSGNIS